MRQNTSATNPESPAIRTLADALERRFPTVSLLTTNNVRPGTRHTAGLAIDIMLDVRTTSEHRRADALIEVFIRLHPVMKWSDLIYSDYDGTTITYFHMPGGGGFGGPNGMLHRNPYTADTRHSDHIHLDWVDLDRSLRNTGDEYLRIPYRWSDRANGSDWAPSLAAALGAIP